MGLWRPNPEYPHKEHLTEFWTRIKTKGRNRQRSRNDEELRVKADVDAKGANELLNKGPFAHPIPMVPGIGQMNQIKCWPPSVPSSMFPGVGSQMGEPAAGKTPEEAAAAAPPGPEPAKTKPTPKPKVAKPLTADTVHGVAQKWCGGMLGEVAKARKTKSELQAQKFGSELVNVLESWATKMMAEHSAIQNLLEEGCTDVTKFRDLMAKGDQVKKQFLEDLAVAKSIIKSGTAKKT